MLTDHSILNIYHILVENIVTSQYFHPMLRSDKTLYFFI